MKKLGKVKPVKIVIWSISTAILLFIFIVLGSLLVQKFIKKSPAPMFAGCAVLIVETGSMSPTINKGDMVIIKKSKEYKPTDIVTYVPQNSSKETITHRLIRYAEGEDDIFIAKGDFNDHEDNAPVSVDQIVGKVVLTIPKVGYVFEWFTHGGGIIYLIAIIVIVVAGVYLWNAMKPEPETAEGDEDEHSQDAQPQEVELQDAGENGEKPQNDNEQV